MLAALLGGLCLQTSCSKRINTQPGRQGWFEREMAAALLAAQLCGPTTQTLALEAAEKFHGRVTPLDYKTRESAIRKCHTDTLSPYQLKDLARTTIAAGWDSTELKPVINYLVEISNEKGLFGRYKHQTSDYGYWGDIVNLKFEQLMTEIQVKTYGMFYASNPDSVAHSVLGDSIYTIIRTNTGVEPGLSHYYYEVMRADTSSAATVARYKQLAITYHALFEHVVGE